MYGLYSRESCIVYFMSNFLILYSRPSTGSARTSTPAITHCTVPTTSAASPVPISTTTPTVATPPNSSTPPVAPDAPKGKAPAGRPTRGNATESAASSSTNPIQLSDLQNFLQGISTAPPDQQSGN